MRRPSRTAVLVGLLGVLAVWIAFDQEGTQLAALSRDEPQTARAEGGKRDAAAPRLPDVPARATLPELRADPFLAHSWEPQVKVVAAPAARTPSAPALPYRFAGRIYQDGAMQVIFGKGDGVLMAKQGDTLDGQYRVESVGDGELTLVYLPMGTKYRMQFSPAFHEIERVDAAVRGADASIGPAALQQPTAAAPDQTRQ